MNDTYSDPKDKYNGLYIKSIPSEEKNEIDQMSDLLEEKHSK